MAVDYQIIAFEDAAKLRQIGLLQEPTPSLDIYGTDFRDVSKVLINGVPSPEFIVFTEKHLVAMIPRSQIGLRLETTAVLSSRELNTAISVISFESCVGNRTAEGRVHLVQSFLLVLFTEQGSNIFNKKLGGNLTKILGQALPEGDLRAQASLAIDRTKNQLMQAQTGDTRLLPSERLKSATLLSVDFSPQVATLHLRLRLTAMDGTTADANLSV